MPYLSWIHTRTLAFFRRFAMSCSVFIQTPTPLLVIKRSCIFRWPIESCVTSVYRSWSWNFFQLMLRYRSWGSVLISIYRLDAHDLKKRKCACDKAIKKNACVRVWIQLDTGFYWSSENALHERFIASSGVGVWMKSYATVHRKAIKKR